MTKHKNAKFSVLIIFILIAAVFFIFDDEILSLFGKKNGNFYDYKTFYELAEQNKIYDVCIEKDKIVFHLKNEISDSENSKSDVKNSEIDFYTENPDSTNLKEFLLLNGVKVSEKKDYDKIFTSILDAVFYIIFFAVIIFVFVKFISPNTFKVVHKTGKTFKDIVGMDSLKKYMIQIMDIMKNPEIYAKKGIRMPKGILLSGQPGNGKTLFAKALAGEAKVNFIPAKATDFESMFMAIGPMKVKLLFKKARRKTPCIVFIDEFDGIGTRRNYSGSAIETENTRIVTALLNELDGFDANQGILVLAATNSISALDEALVRPGRFDAKIEVPFPDENARRDLIKMYSKDKILASDCSVENLAVKFKGFSCAKIESVLNKAALILSQSGKNEISMNEINLALKEV